MGKETVLFSSEEKINSQQAAAFLHQLADKIAERQVVLRQGDNELVLVLPDQLVLELKVEEELKSGREKRTLEIELEWFEGGEAEGSVTLG
jgi:amphi-Trp domain-containing protein